jgi:hypothetical protein
MKYDRQDSMAKAKDGKEPQKLKASLLAPKGYTSSLDKEEEKNAKRRSFIEREFNKIRKDPF